MFEIHRGLRQRPTIIMLYGLPGVGKSELASQYGNTLFLDLENGVDFLDVASIKLQTYQEIINGLAFASKQEFDTIVIDSWSAVEKITLAHTLAEHGAGSLSDFDFGKGYAYFRKNLQYLLKGIGYLQKVGKNSVIIAHSVIKRVEDPTTASYDRVQFDADKNILSDLNASCDGCFYFRPLIRTFENKDKDIRAVANGSKELVLQDKGGATSKCRFNHMPQSVEFPYEPDEKKRKKMYAEFWNKLTNKPTNKE